MKKITFLIFLLLFASCNQDKIDSIKLTNKGIVAFNNKNYDNAYDYFTKAIALDSTNYTALYMIGMVFFYGKNKPEIAEKYFEDALKINKKHGDSLFQLGIIKRLKKDYKDAITLFKKTLKTDFPEKDEVYLQLGEIALKLKNYKAADTYFRNAIRFNPTNFKAYHSLAYLYYILKNYDKALAVIDQCLKVKKDYAPAYFLKTQIYKNQGKLIEAKNAALEGLKYDPINKFGFFFLGYVYAKLDDYKSAIYNFNQFISRADNLKDKLYITFARNLIDKLWWELDRKVANLPKILNLD